MNIFIAVVFFILILFIAVSVTYYIYSYKSPDTDFAPSLGSLDTQTTIGTSADLTNNFFKTSTSTFFGFIKLLPADRTANINGSMTTLLNFGNIFSLEIAQVPGKAVGDDYSTNTGRSNLTTAQLRIVTVSGGQNTVETIPLPNFPTQRWVCLGILRDGRRIDVVYDNQIVASKRLTGSFINTPYGPLIVSPTQQSNGQSKFLGNFIHFFLKPQRLSVYDFNDFRAKFVDTNGSVVLKDVSLPIPGLSNVNMSGINLFGTDQPTQPPQDTMKAWSTPYE